MIRNPISWCVWATAAVAAAFMERSPFTQALLLLVLINVWLPYRQSRITHLRFGVTLAVIPILFSVALSRFGNHVIFTLPLVPFIGGRWTWDALVFGASTGTALLLTVGVFAILQSTVRSADLIGLLPRPLYRAGTVFALSLAFAPKAIRSFHSIEEARWLRGLRTGWRAAPAVLVPLMMTTLEQALQYGESLDARGYGNLSRSRYRPIAWSLPDRFSLALAAVALVLIVAFPAASFDPYTNLVPSTPSITSLLAVLLLSAPGLLAAVPRSQA